MGQETLGRLMCGMARRGFVDFDWIPTNMMRRPAGNNGSKDVSEFVRIDFGRCYQMGLATSIYEYLTDTFELGHVRSVIELVRISQRKVSSMRGGLKSIMSRP